MSVPHPNVNYIETPLSLYARRRSNSHFITVRKLRLSLAHAHRANQHRCKSSVRTLHFGTIEGETCCWRAALRIAPCRSGAGAGSMRYDRVLRPVLVRRGNVTMNTLP